MTTLTKILNRKRDYYQNILRWGSRDMRARPSQILIDKLILRSIIGCVKLLQLLFFIERLLP